ncbi:MAG: endonuclease VIII [Myxococcota bacterium]
MPEGPEIRRAADRVEAAVRGREIQKVYFAVDRLKEFEEELQAQTVTRVETRGKAMLTWFGEETAVYSHNQLYGRWMIRNKPGLPKTNRQLRFAIHTERGAALLYSATDIDVLDREGIDAHPFLSRIGPDPLHETVTPARIRKRLERPEFRRKRLSTLLLDQSFLAGVGNYLRSEILFEAGVHPDLRPVDLPADVLALLARSVCKTMRRAYQSGGVTTDAALVTRLKRAGRPKRAYRHWVFGRERDLCHRCDASVERYLASGRRIFFCPGCQPQVPLNKSAAGVSKAPALSAAEAPSEQSA